MNGSAPPKARRLGAALFACALVAALGAAPSPALAKTVHRDGFDSMPGGSIYLNPQLPMSSGTFSAAGDAFFLRGRQIYAKAPHGGSTSLASVPGSFTLSFENVGLDADGDAVDLRVACSNVRYVPSRSNGEVAIFGNWYDDSDGDLLEALYGDGARYDVTLSIYKHGSLSPASGAYLFGLRDIDIVDPSDGALSEQVKLKSGFREDIYLTSSSLLSVSEDGTRFAATRIDGNTLDSGLLVLGDPAGMSIEFSGGNGCGTVLLDDLGTYTIDASAGEGGSISPAGSTSVMWHNDRTFAIAPAEGHRISDVRVDGTSVGKVPSYTFRSVTSDHAIRAEFERIPCQVAFKAPDGTVLDEQTVLWGDGAAEPAHPDYLGYTFTGWDRSFDRVTGDIVVTARYEPNPYAVRFDANGGTGSMGDQQMTYDTTANLDGCAFSKEGHAFRGWSTSADGQGGLPFFDRQAVRNLTSVRGGAVTLYAQWRRLSYPVTFTDGQGRTICVEHTPWATAATAPEDPEREGYVFRGWDRSFERVTGALTVNATWAPSRYAVAFDANGGTGSMGDQRMTFDEAAELDKCAFANPGHTFRGWSLSAGGAVSYEDAQRVSNLTAEDGGKVTLYAVWEEDAPVAISYKVSDPAHGTVSSDADVVAPATGEARGSTAQPAPGYKVVGWAGPDGNPASDGASMLPARGADGLWHAATYTALIEPADYAVAFDANGGTGSMGDQRMTFDEAAELDKCSLERAGCRFAGWNTAPDGSGDAYGDRATVMNLTAEDGGKVTLYAQWAPRVLTVTFTDGCGNVLESEQVEYGRAARAPEASRAGFELAGWDEPFGCVTEDMTVNAQWRRISADAGESAGPTSGPAAERGRPVSEASPAQPEELAQTGQDAPAAALLALVGAAASGTALALRRRS